ncbi:MAG: MarR family transcriptional regulator [Acidobacteriota bacterium]|nr:MarR family transcriptional regulator [Acidobacteriota bacterium]
MHLREELKISKPIEPGHEVALALLLTREYVSRILDEQVFKKAGITDQQFNVLRILKGGPKDGYLIGEIKERMIFRNADVPRLVNRLAAQGLVKRCENPQDRRGSRIRLTPKGDAFQDKVRPIHAGVCEDIDGCLSEAERDQLLSLLERLRDHYRWMLADKAEG